MKKKPKASAAFTPLRKLPTEVDIGVGRLHSTLRRRSGSTLVDGSFPGNFPG